MMAKSIWQRTALAATGILLLGALAGCAAAGTAAVTAPSKGAAKPAAGFSETKKVEDLSVTLAAQPFQVGENLFSVTLNQPDVKTVEAQIIMTSMGHGQVLELAQVAPGKFEAKSAIIDMVGPWMVRVQAVTASDTELTATFMTQVKE